MPEILQFYMQLLVLIVEIIGTDRNEVSDSAALGSSLTFQDAFLLSRVVKLAVCAVRLFNSAAAIRSD